MTQCTELCEAKVFMQPGTRSDMEMWHYQRKDLHCNAQCRVDHLSLGCWIVLTLRHLGPFFQNMMLKFSYVVHYRCNVNIFGMKLVQYNQYILAPCALRWRHNGCDGVSNHQLHDCLLHRLFKAQIKENIKALCHWPLCGEFTGDRWIPHTKCQ